MTNPSELTLEQQRALDILGRLTPLYRESLCPLNYKNPFELLIAVILAAQCTDERVNQVTLELFRRFQNPAAIAEADPSELESILKPLSLYRNKTKYVIGTAKMLVDKFAGEVPRDIKQLVKLPGVARKTAAMVLHYAYDIDAGIAVDTHVKRLSDRLGFTKQTDPAKIEKDLMQLLPESEWGNCFVDLTYHGRNICYAKNPQCNTCAVADLCPSVM